MSLTRSLLKEMHLADDQIEQIIRAHVETVDALKAEIASAASDRELLTEQIAELSRKLQDADAVQAEFDAYKTQTQSALSAAEKQQAVREALIKAGANEKAVALLAREIDPDSMDIQGGVLVNARELLAPLREKYAAFFAQPVRIPAQIIQPPASLHGALTRQDVSRMSPEEINQNWDAVRTVLARH